MLSKKGYLIHSAKPASHAIDKSFESIATYGTFGGFSTGESHEQVTRFTVGDTERLLDLSRNDFPRFILPMITLLRDSTRLNYLVDNTFFICVNGVSGGASYFRIPLGSKTYWSSQQWEFGNQTPVSHIIIPLPRDED